MNIDHLIEQLNHLKSCGVKNLAIVDSNWKDYELEQVGQNDETDLAFMIINPIVEEEEE